MIVVLWGKKCLHIGSKNLSSREVDRELSRLKLKSLRMNTLDSSPNSHSEMSIFSAAWLHNCGLLVDRIQWNCNLVRVTLKGTSYLNPLWTRHCQRANHILSYFEYGVSSWKTVISSPVEKGFFSATKYFCPATEWLKWTRRAHNLPNVITLKWELSSRWSYGLLEFHPYFEYGTWM